MIAPLTPHADSTLLATNIRRLMAKYDLKYTDVIESTGIDERTLRNIMKKRAQPHARTVKKIADGLGVELDELYKPVDFTSSANAFDEATNTLVSIVVERNPEIFEDWTYHDFEEIYSTFGTGGQLTETGILATARSMNTIRELKHMFAVVMQSSDAELLAVVVREMYRRVTVRMPGLPDVPRRTQ